jgi:magnesium transporter
MREALSEIEVPSRLSKEGNNLYLSVPVTGQVVIEHAELSPAGLMVGQIFS